MPASVSRVMEWKAWATKSVWGMCVCARACMRVSVFCGLNSLVIISKLSMCLSAELRKKYFLLVPCNEERAQVRLLCISLPCPPSLHLLSVRLSPCLPVLKPAAAVSDFHPLLILPSFCCCRLPYLSAHSVFLQSLRGISRDTSLGSLFFCIFLRQGLAL